MRVLLFTNLFPSSLAPTHGSFIRERMDRLANRLDCEYRVLHPLPLYPPMPGRNLASRHSRLAARETVDDVPVEYPRYFHLPRCGVTRQAERMRRGVRRCFMRMLAEWRPDLVDAQYLYPDGCAAIDLAREAGLPCLVTARGSDVNVLGRMPAVRIQLHDKLAHADRCLAVSRDLADKVAALAGWPQEAVAVSPNGVDLERFAPGDGPAVRRLIAVGRLVPGKGQEVLIRALATERGRAIPRLVLIGDGPERRRLMALAATLAVADRVDWRGELGRQEVATELALGGVFAAPSRREGWPNAVLEALAAGLPVVACPVGGTADMLGGTGHLLPLAAGAEEWAETMAALLERLMDEGDTLRAAACRRAEVFSWDRCLDVPARIYQELCA